MDVPPSEYTTRTIKRGGYMPNSMLLKDIRSIMALKSAKENESDVPMNELRSSTIR